MTDPTNPTSTGRPDPVEAQLRATLQAAAPTDTDVDGGLADLKGRIDGDLALAPAGRDHSRRRFLLAAAAAVLVVAAIAAAALSGGDGGSVGTSLATDPPQPTTPTTTALDVPESTSDTAPTTTQPETSQGPTDYPASESGWYVPVGLPAGWSVDSVSVGQRKLPGSIPGAGAYPDDVTTVVSVVLRNPNGDPVGYALTAPGQGQSFDNLASPLEYRAEGQVAVLDQYLIDGPGGHALHRFTGSWPNADIVLGDDTTPGEIADPDEDDLILLASLLRPASTDEWRAFLGGATVNGSVANAAGLPDIIA